MDWAISNEHIFCVCARHSLMFFFVRCHIFTLFINPGWMQARERREKNLNLSHKMTAKRKKCRYCIAEPLVKWDPTAQYSHAILQKTKKQNNKIRINSLCTQKRHRTEKKTIQTNAESRADFRARYAIRLLSFCHAEPATAATMMIAHMKNSQFSFISSYVFIGEQFT